jgi:NTP pyrophosphatase (non-canonical NTP hydrolase)
LHQRQRTNLKIGFIFNPHATLIQLSSTTFNQIQLSLMTLLEAQQKVDEWINSTGVRYFNELTNMAILTEEVGEVARLMSRIYGEQSFKESDKGSKLSDELADVLWVVLCIANQTGVNLTEALEKNFDKKNMRDGERHRLNEKLGGAQEQFQE